MWRKVSILKGIALIFFINAVKGNEQCANYGEVCDSFDQHSCCDVNLKCKWSNYMNRNQCSRNAKLGDYCLIKDDCSALHSTCSTTGKCICRQNNVEVNGTNCVPLLGEFCWKESCAPENSICIKNECQCKSDFLSKSNDRCLPDVILQETPCESDKDCESIAFAKCSHDKTCVCSDNTIAMSSKFCSLLLEEYCRNDQECGINHSLCIDHECRCKPQFIPYSKTVCKPSFLGMPCTNSTQCQIHIKNTICVDDKCACDIEYFPWNENLCISESQKCENDIECVEPNFVCIDEKCQCNTNYLLWDNKCLPKYLGGPCEVTSDCANIEFTVCARYECICNEGFFPFNRTACTKKLGHFCSVDENCYITNSHCYQNLCKCRDGYINDSHQKCLPIELRRFCFVDDDCKLIRNARCSSRNKCVCKREYVGIDEYTCAAFLGGDCLTDNDCMTENSVCINKKCRCDSKNFQRYNNRCVHIFLKKFCTVDADCIDIPYANCSNAQKCICGSNYMQLEANICVPLLEGYCSHDKGCVTENSVCFEGTCQCTSAYRRKLPNECEPISLGQPCETNIDCSLIYKARCSSDKICVCNSDTFALNKMTCTPFLDSFCELDECEIESSHCVENKCHCKPGYSAMSATQCLRTKSLYSCMDDSECVEPWHFECSRHKQCVCKFDNIAISNSTCLPILGGYCWKDDQCTIDNSECYDFRCRCKLNFKTVSKNMCI